MDGLGLADPEGEVEEAGLVDLVGLVGYQGDAYVAPTDLPGELLGQMVGGDGPSGATADDDDPVHHASLERAPAVSPARALVDFALLGLAHDEAAVLAHVVRLDQLVADFLDPLWDVFVGA